MRFRKTKLVFCNNRLCVHNNWCSCDLRKVALDTNGMCAAYSPIFVPNDMEGISVEPIREKDSTAVKENENNSITSIGGNKIGF